MYQDANKVLQDKDLTFMLNPFEHEEVREKFAITKADTEKSPILEYINEDQVTSLTVLIFIGLALSIILFMLRESVKSILELAKPKAETKSNRGIL